MKLFEGLEKLINEHGSSTILKERIALANDKFSALETEMQKAMSEKDSLASEVDKLNNILEYQDQKIRKLEQQLSNLAETSKKFTEIRGIKIRNLPAGKFEEEISYCFHCESPLSSTHRTKNLECSKCGYKTSIQARHLCVVLSELKGEETPDWWRKY